jgi:hypothetical protein
VDDETRGVVRGIFEILENQTKRSYQALLVSSALLAALRESQPNLESLYARHHKALSDGEIGKAHALALASIQQMIQMMGEDDGGNDGETVN